MVPPTTKRFCLGCQKLTDWQYNKVVGHSRCMECGGMFSSKHELSPEIIDNASKKLMPWIMNNNKE